MKDKHMQISIFFKQFEKNIQKVKSNTFKNINDHIFLNKCQNLFLKQSKYLIFLFSSKDLKNRRLTHANFYFFLKKSRRKKCKK